MKGYKTFSEFLAQRDAASDAAPQPPRPDDRGAVPAAESPLCYDPHQPDAMGDEEQVEERSTFRNPFRGVFKAVNPARPVLPTNSRLLASPFRKRRLKSQVVG